MTHKLWGDGGGFERENSALACDDASQDGGSSVVAQQKNKGGGKNAAVPNPCFFKKSGAGEGIRTLDPNLGKAPEGSTPRYPAPRHGLILIDNSTT